MMRCSTNVACHSRMVENPTRKPHPRSSNKHAHLVCTNWSSFKFFPLVPVLGYARDLWFLFGVTHLVRERGRNLAARSRGTDITVAKLSGKQKNLHIQISSSFVF